MGDWGQFEKFDDAVDCTGETPGLPASCQVCEAMLPDAVDGTLSEAEQRAFDRHVAGCVVCARELEEARRGAAWLGMLKQQSPEPSALLLDRILAETTGSLQLGAAGQPAVREASSLPAPVWTATSLPLPQQRRPAVRAATAWQTITGSFSLDGMRHMLRPMLQPRLAMTAAMAFFSVALTLNMTGVRLSTVSAASLRPSAVRRTVADRSAAVVRSFQNIPVVYQSEARMNDLRSNWQQQQGDEAPAQTAPQTGPNVSKPDTPETIGPGASRKPDQPHGSSRLEFAPVDPRGASMTRKGA